MGGVPTRPELSVGPDDADAGSPADSDEGTLVVSEVFGPTFQGEGPSVGRRSGFVRLGRCNLDCAWCDTPYTWDTTRFDLRQERRRVPGGELVAEVLDSAADLVVVTGGEPLLQAEPLVPLVLTCRRDGRAVEIETNGTITPPSALVAAGVRWNVSPKLANSGIVRERRIRPEVLRAFADSAGAVFKFVVTRVADLDEIADVVAEFGLGPVWVMPEGDSVDRMLPLLRQLAGDVLARGWNLTARLQVLVWDGERGR